MPRKVFVANEILTAADVNTNLMDQAVMVFDDSAARGSAIPSPIEGMVTYLKDTDAIEKFNGSAFVPVGTILQVVQTVKSDTQTITSLASGTFAAITGLTASITPSSTSSKILAHVTVLATTTFDAGVGLIGVGVLLKRDSTAVGIGNAASNRSRVSGMTSAGSGNSVGVGSLTFLDSPATTSAITYSVEILNQKSTADTIQINRTVPDSDNATQVRGVCSITLMEVAG
jgi:hypothetical protein